MNFYFDAAKALDQLDAKKGSVKGVIASLSEKDRKRGSAVIIETLKYKEVLLEVINKAGLLTNERQKITSLNLALLLVHDLLLSRGIQAGDGPVKQAVLRHKTRLNAELQKLKIRRGVKNVNELAQAPDPRSAQIPRYVRVNTLLWTVPDAVNHFTREGFVQDDDPMNSSKSFRLDDHIHELLAFHPSVRFHDDECLTDGRIILQDKASCFPAAVLSPPADEGAHVIDATAAPGNKTTHLSALMHNHGKLFAFERDKKRFNTLRKMVGVAQCKNVECINADFLAIDPADSKFNRVTHILLDPSCSGSGIVNRLDYLLDNDEEIDGDDEEARLANLASFQLKMIRHAMKFETVQKIAYSTCSVHEIENENVVAGALASPEAAGAFELCPHRNVLPKWPRRGFSTKLDDADARAVVRCSPSEDRTNGFFVSCFQRISLESKNEAQTTSSGKRRMEDGDGDGDSPSTDPPQKSRRKKKRKTNTRKDGDR